MNYSELSDLELLDHFKKGEESAFDELFKRHKQPLVRVAKRYTGDPQISEDVAHEVFMEIHQNPDGFRGDGRFFAYLYGITFNKSKKYIRGKVRKRELPLFPEEGEGEPGHISSAEPASSIHDKKELSQLLQKAIDQLPETYRKVFILCEVEELSYEEVAVALGITRTNVGFHLFKAREKLRKLLPMELLEIFLFHFNWRIHEEGAIAMSLLLENVKLAFGIPSETLMSFYHDGEVNRWQADRIESILKRSEVYQHQQADYRKIKILYTQMEEPELSFDFDLRLERKLARGLERKVEKRLIWRPVLAPVLAVIVAGFGFLIAYPIFQGSPLYASSVYGAVKIFEPSTSTWTPLISGFKFKEGQRLRTEAGGSLDLTLKDKVTLRVKENSEIELQKLFRSRQKGHLVIQQSNGKVLAGLSPKFKGSELSVDTPYGSANAYGTLFLVEVNPAVLATRVMALEGIVELTDLRRTKIQPLPPQTEALLTEAQINPAQPIPAARRAEIEELLSLPVSHKEKAKGILEENLSLLLLASPGRVKEFLENPRIKTQRTFPILTETIQHARERIMKADQENQPALYDEAIRDLEEFMEIYLDPNLQFKPHISFFIGATYYSLGRYKEALKSFAQLTTLSDPEWRALGHKARALVYERLQEPSSALEEHQAAKAIAPKGSYEA